MKIQKLLFCLMAFIIASCDEKPVLITPSETGNGNDGLFILCEVYIHQKNRLFFY